MKIVARSNEDEDLLVGELIRYDRRGSHPIPVLRRGEEEYLCFGIVFPYDEDFVEFLRGYSPEKQWKLCRKLFSGYKEIGNGTAIESLEVLFNG